MKILIADDHALFRESLVHFLAVLTDKEHVLQAETAGQAIAIIDEQSDIDLVLLDLKLPDMEGFEALKIITREHPSVPVVILSGTENHQDMLQALDGGARGFIHKTSSTQVMLNAIKLVLDGGTYVPEQALAYARSRESNNAAKFDLDALDLTERQKEVVREICKGHSNKQIARELGISESTVKSHISSIMLILNVHNRHEIIAGIMG